MSELRSQSTRYLISEKHLSFDNRFLITDESGSVHYKVNSTFFALGDKLSIFDQHENELVRIRQNYPHFHLTYKVYSIQNGTLDKLIASAKRTGPLWQHKLEISSSHGEYILQKNGGVSSNIYNLTKNGNLIAIATKDVSPTKSLYWIDIVDDREPHLFILTVIIILSCAQRVPGNPIARPPVNTSKI